MYITMYEFTPTWCEFTTVNSNSRSGVFTVPISGYYLLSLTVCSQDKKKVLLSIRRNGEELASLYDQNHNDNHANTMSSQVPVKHRQTFKLVNKIQSEFYF